jgi:hypothetical protein
VRPGNVRCHIRRKESRRVWFGWCSCFVFEPGIAKLKGLVRSFSLHLLEEFVYFVSRLKVLVVVTVDFTLGFIDSLMSRTGIYGVA